MSAAFMYAIAAMYAAAGIAFLIDGKPMWFVVSYCWGIGNAILGMLSAK